MFQLKIELGSKEALNVDLDVIWETLPTSKASGQPKFVFS
jgi:hypothetical protein